MRYVVLLVLSSAYLPPNFASAQTGTFLPSERTESVLRSLPANRELNDQLRSSAPLQELKVEVERLPQHARENLKLNEQGSATKPLIVPNTILLQFEPNVSQESVEELLKRKSLTVIESFPKLGAVKAAADLSKYFSPSLDDRSANDTLWRGVQNVITDFKAEPIVRSATPDVVLQRQADVGDSKNLMKASLVTTLVAEADGEAIDWGIKNIEADKLWTMYGARDGALFGVMDVGFARHEDIIFLELPAKIEVDDHGNHVAAIACARHGNRRGVKGVIPNCFVRARTGDVFFKSVADGPTGFFVIFSQILASLDRFLDQHDDIRVINLSMGYNWRSNFGINPDLAESKQWRTLVESQGAFLVPALELADKAGKVIFSAAGNDSSGLATPISAKYASPFNWAAITAREKDIARNGVVVEAHGPSNKRASFSNRGGHMSCPGLDILSAVAKDAGGNEVETMYGKMSGTSMASPYCASALLLLSLVRPGYSGTELVDCLLASTEKSDSGTPIPKLSQAIAKCPAR